MHRHSVVQVLRIDWMCCWTTGIETPLLKAYLRVSPTLPLRRPSVNNTTVVVASPPPMFSPFGFSPFGGFGFGFGMPVIVPVGGGFLSGLISLMFVTLLFSVVFNVIRGFMSQQNKEQQRKDDRCVGFWCSLCHHPAAFLVWKRTCRLLSTL